MLMINRAAWLRRSLEDPEVPLAACVLGELLWVERDLSDREKARTTDSSHCTHAELLSPPPEANNRRPPTLQYASSYDDPLADTWSVMGPKTAVHPDCAYVSDAHCGVEEDHKRQVGIS